MHKPTFQASKRQLLMATGWQRRGACRWRVLVGRDVPVARTCTWTLLVLGLVVAFANSDLRVRPASWSSPRTGQHKLNKVASYHRRAATLLQNSFGREDVGATDGLLDLAALYQRQARYAEAEMLYDRALVILMYHLGADSPRVTDTLDRLAELHRQQGNTAMANSVAEFARSELARREP